MTASPAAVLLPLGILFTALLLFAGGFAWARRRDKREQARQILDKIEPWAGSRRAAKAWYQSHPIAALGNWTAAALVAHGRGEDVLRFLDHIEAGGFA
ncbi:MULTISPECIES: hypothetical protein [Halomonas]|uniref:hypothetical protein n=1 Tax=Halomonas TaxID=2745 RepID=UPI0028A019A9|nr:MULTISPECIES: hypothetical protein [Halomonas]